MPFREIIRLSFEALLANKFRAALTMLGMSIGVAAVVLLVSLGNGAKHFILGEFEGLGSNLIMVQPGKTDAKGHMGPPVGAAQRKMTIADVHALERSALSLEAVSGLIMGTTSIRYDDAISNVTTFGCSSEFIRILNLSVVTGTFFSKEEHDSGRRVAVIGTKVSRNLFGEDSPLGKQVKIHQSEFKVIGVLSAVGDKIGINLDEMVFIPTFAAMKLFNDDKLFGIRAKAKSKSSIDDAVAEISSILKDRRDGEEDFTIVTQGAVMQSMSVILDMLTYVLAGIACISMVVAGIGIMNIMLVSVTERTQEIGIRRAVGARRIDILNQFLAEAVTLSFVGGTIGVILALIMTHSAFYFFPKFDMRPPLWVVGPAFGIASVVGIIAGAWPARRASTIETLDALRYE